MADSTWAEQREPAERLTVELERKRDRATVAALLERIDALEAENKRLNAECGEHLQARARSAKLLDRIFAAVLDPRNPPRVPPDQAPETAYAEAVIAALARFDALRGGGR